MYNTSDGDDLPHGNITQNGINMIMDYYAPSDYDMSLIPYPGIIKHQVTIQTNHTIIHSYKPCKTYIHANPTNHTMMQIIYLWLQDTITLSLIHISYKRTLFWALTFNIAYKIHFFVEEKMLVVLDTYAKKMIPTSMVFWGGCMVAYFIYNSRNNFETKQNISL